MGSDLPENNDAPPPFPFPTTSTSRLPPTFQSTEQQPLSPSNQAIPIPNSPPPTFEQATGLQALPSPPPTAANPLTSDTDETPRPTSRASTRYMSAPSSPVLTALESVEDTGQSEMGPDERNDRRMWNADLLAGYTLGERVERELNRKRAREGRGTDTELDIPSPVPPEDEAATTGQEVAESGNESAPVPEPEISTTVALPVESEVGSLVDHWRGVPPPPYPKSDPFPLSYQDALGKSYLDSQRPDPLQLDHLVYGVTYWPRSPLWGYRQERRVDSCSD